MRDDASFLVEHRGEDATFHFLDREEFMLLLACLIDTGGTVPTFQLLSQFRFLTSRINMTRCGPGNQVGIA